MDTSYLTTEVNKIIGQLHELFDDIGVPSHERESRETELFSALSDTLNSQLRRVTDEKNEMLAEAQRLMRTIKQMEASLEDPQPGQRENVDLELQVTFPLSRYIDTLKERYNKISKLHRDRFEQVKKLVEALESYSSHLEPSFVSIPLPPTAPGTSVPPTFNLSPSYITALDSEFSKVYEEYMRRISTVKNVSEEIIKLWAELGTPQLQTDTTIVANYRDAPEQLGLHESDIASLRTKRDKLVEDKASRERRLKELKAAVESLWDRLGIEEKERKGFLAANRGCGLRAINEFQEELNRLNELKRQNLHLFVEDARCKLQELWDSLYYSEEEMLDFTPAFSDVYSDALLSAHEAEIARLEALKEQRAPVLELIDKYRSLIQDRDNLAASSQDASRLMARNNKGERRDPSRLLREEKMRKRITRDLPKIEAELRKILEQWEDEYGRPFLVHGDRFIDELASAPVKVPPRSKTPCGPPCTVSRPTSTKPTLSGQSAGSIKAPQPSLSTARSPAANGTLKRGILTRSAAVNNAAKSPSRIPAPRVPLGNMPHGSNSPERRQPPSSSELRDKMPPPLAPPPKMRDLLSLRKQATPQSVNMYSADSERCESAMSTMSSRNVRPLSPGDVYDDRPQRSYLGSSVCQPLHNGSTNSFQSSSQTSGSQGEQYHKFYSSTEQSYPPSLASSRQISNSSTIHTVTSGSENWETYDDASDEPEADATAVYYAKLRAAHGKRIAADGHYPNGYPGKKIKGIRGVGVQETLADEDGQIKRVDGSDGGWTDDLEAY